VPQSTVQVTLPEMGESVTEGTVAKWLKQVGETVRQGEGLVEVTTDKVDAEVPAPTTGRLLKILANTGDTIPVGSPLAELAIGDGDGATPEAVTTPAPAAAPAAPVPAPAAPALGAPAPAAGGATLPSPPLKGGDALPAQAPQQAVDASEGAQLLAQARGIDLSTIAGTGRDGAITRRDVLQAAEARENSTTEVAPPAVKTAPAEAAPLEAPAQAPATPGLVAGTTPLRGPAATLVTYMEESLEIPTATSFRTVPVSTLDRRRQQLNQALQAAGRPEKVSYTHLIAWAIVRAVQDIPSMAVAFERVDGKPQRVARGVHLGLAVDLQRPEGGRFLVVPVIKTASQLTFAAFRDRYETLVAKARTNKLAADDLRGATITLTNPGGIGTVASVPRLMKGQGTIVATGAIGYPAQFSGMSETALRQLGVSKVMTMSSTYDHRVIQGAESGEFLRRIEELLGGADSFYESVFASLGLQAPADLASAGRSLVALPEGVEGTPTETAELVRGVAAGTALVAAYRSHGHLAARLDPLGGAPTGDPSLDPLNLGLTEELMRAVPAGVLRVRVPGETLAEVLPHLRETYCSTIAYEIEHISSHEQRNWLRERIESGRYRQPLSPERARQLLGRLTKVDAMERYLRRAFLGQKTFSIEGLDAMVVMLEEAISLLAEEGTRQAVMGMAHRGRLSVIAHVVNRPYESILVEFEQGKARVATGDVSGDVKYLSLIHI